MKLPKSLIDEERLMEVAQEGGGMWGGDALGGPVRVAPLGV